MRSDAYLEGYRAYQDDLKLEDNPYDSCNQENEWEEWREGYYDAGWDN